LTKDTDYIPENWRDKCCKDGEWLKWIVERLESQDQIDSYNELKDRIHNKLGLTDLTESCMLRFLTGLEYDVDTAEENLIFHHNYMIDYNMYEISDERIPTLKPLNILVAYGQDKFERPISYMRVSRFVPSKHEFDELRDY
jgi:hypothetical protein